MLSGPTGKAEGAGETSCVEGRPAAWQFWVPGQEGLDHVPFFRLFSPGQLKVGFNHSLAHSQFLELLNMLAEILFNRCKCPRSSPHCRETAGLFILLLIKDRRIFL